MESDDFTNVVINRISIINDLRGKLLYEKVSLLSQLLTLEGSDRKWLLNTMEKDAFLSGVKTY